MKLQTTHIKKFKAILQNTYTIQFSITYCILKVIKDYILTKSKLLSQVKINNISIRFSISLFNSIKFFFIFFLIFFFIFFSVLFFND